LLPFALGSTIESSLNSGPRRYNIGGLIFCYSAEPFIQVTPFISTSISTASAQHQHHHRRRHSRLRLLIDFCGDEYNVAEQGRPRSRSRFKFRQPSRPATSQPFIRLWPSTFLSQSRCYRTATVSKTIHCRRLAFARTSTSYLTSPYLALPYLTLIAGRSPVLHVIPTLARGQDVEEIRAREERAEKSWG